jgi:hypothetical protein
VISVEEYQDATGTDNKESFSLEPCLLSTGLLKSEFNGDHRSRFIIGYIPSFSKQKSSADQRRRAGTQKVLDPAFAITTSVFQSLQPLVKAQMDPPFWMCDLGIKSSECRSRNGCSSGWWKSNDMLCGRVMSSSRTMRLSRATFTPSAVASDTTQLFHWINSAVIERVTRAAMFDVSDTQRSEWNRHLHYLPTEARKKKHRSAAGGVESQLKSYGRPLKSCGT